MIAEIALTILNLALLSYHLWTAREERKERGKLIDALINKRPDATWDFTGTSTEGKPEPPEPEEYVPVSSLPDKEFDKAIKQELEE